MMRSRLAIVLPLVGALVLTAPALAANRRLAIVVDTSGSMQDADRQRYTMQLSQVLSDLVDTGDELSVIRMPEGLFSSCFARASPSLVLQLDPNNRASFKQQLDRFITFNTGTWFAAPIRTAITLLPPQKNVQRMLLVIADSGGLGSCEGELTNEMLELKRGGATIAAINIGSSTGAFDRNPAFDFTTAALDEQGLIEAVALVYQRFLGAKKVQTGDMQEEISVDIAPYVDEAFLVVAADGPISAVEQVRGNPSAAAIDLNHRGGGSTMGIDGILRGYRIVRLERPSPGKWRFRGTGMRHSAGWMLLQDSAVGLRLVSSPTIPRGAETTLEVELFDQRTGARIADSSQLPGLQTALEIDGREVVFRDDGTAGDRQAGDGILTATTTFDRTGQQALTVHLQSDFLDRRIGLTANVIDAAWRVEVRTPPRVEVDRAVSLTGVVQPIGSAKGLPPPDRIDVLTGSDVVELRDDGTKGDKQAGDNTFTRDWTPPQAGKFHFDYKPEGGGPSIPASVPIEVIGRLRFGAPLPIRFGRLHSESIGTGQLDLSSADVRGEFPIQVSTRFDRARSVLEIDPGTGWVALGPQPLTLQLRENGARSWPIRIRVGECPEAHAAGTFALAILATGPDDQPIRTSVPVSVEIVADSWLHCWWPVLALALGAVVAAIAIHGYWSPSRFSPRLGVVLSPEEDIAEGFFHPIRAQRGSSSGFYRDARVFICGDFRVSGRPRNAVARLRADGKQVRIAPADGALVWRRTADGNWEQISIDESPVRFGDLYRNDPGSLFFELRNA
ncbi:MAG TPA: VWA domain-containing protein [Thermoanaerobaculia bacterium]|jgi:hypothetical protein